LTCVFFSVMFVIVGTDSVRANVRPVGIASSSVRADICDVGTNLILVFEDLLIMFNCMAH